MTDEPLLEYVSDTEAADLRGQIRDVQHRLGRLAREIAVGDDGCPFTSTDAVDLTSAMAWISARMTLATRRVRKRAGQL